MKAFPRSDGKFNSSKADEQGMDLRDYFAAKAMQALISRKDFGFEDYIWEKAYDIADAMMRARER